MSTQHTPEPWEETTHSRTRRETGGFIVQIYRAMSDDDYERTRACVNACAGMADPAAEIARLREVNIALLVAARYIVEAVPPRDAHEEAMFGKLRAAIAKAEEKP